MLACVIVARPQPDAHTYSALRITVALSKMSWLSALWAEVWSVAQHMELIRSIRSARQSGADVKTGELAFRNVLKAIVTFLWVYYDRRWAKAERGFKIKQANAWKGLSPPEVWSSVPIHHRHLLRADIVTKCDQHKEEMAALCPKNGTASSAVGDTLSCVWSIVGYEGSSRANRHDRKKRPSGEWLSQMSTLQQCSDLFSMSVFWGMVEIIVLVFSKWFKFRNQIWTLPTINIHNECFICLLYLFCKSKKGLVKVASKK